jgi:prepilin-type N-terminal cleavage/methylation domain-containing protein
VNTRGSGQREPGFALAEIIIAIAILAILAGMLAPFATRYVEDGRVAQARSDAERIAKAVRRMRADVGQWPLTNRNGPSGQLDRLVTSTNVARNAAPGAGPGARNWGRFGRVKQLGDFLHWNNPDNDSSTAGAAASQPDQDYPSRGAGAWRGPYLESYSLDDPWGRAYVINARYFPGGRYAGDVRHSVMVLSAGPDGLWDTPFSDGTPEGAPQGDDVGFVIPAAITPGS